MFNNYTSNYDKQNKQIAEKFLEDSTVKIYEGLYKKVIKENNSSLEELENKIDTIMDALGLKNEDDVEKEEKEVKITTKDNDEGNTVVTDIEETEEEENNEENSLDSINFIEEQ